MADVDDQRAHHFNDYKTEKTKKQIMNLSIMKMRYLKTFKNMFQEHIKVHYTGTKHEFRKVQTIDLMAARLDIATFWILSSKYS